MKRFIFAVLLAVFVPMSAHAGWNVRQNDDGTTSWVREDRQGVERTVDVGESHLTVFLEDISTSSTTYVTVPLTDVRVSFIQSVIFNTITDTDATITFWKLDSSGTVLAQLTDANLGTMTIATESVTGTVDSFTPTDETANHMEQNHVIAIHTDGASVNDSDATITITIVPR